jgi:hypothetical protein
LNPVHLLVISDWWAGSLCWASASPSDSPDK